MNTSSPVDIKVGRKVQIKKVENYPRMIAIDLRVITGVLESIPSYVNHTSPYSPEDAIIVRNL